MSVEHIEVVVEEPSMEAALRALLPKILGDTSFVIHAHRCKDELLLRLPQRLNGYSKFLPASGRIVVIVDRDDDECLKLKAKLEDIAHRAKLKTRTRAGGSKCQVVNRIVIEELEAWYFGDWAAVKAAYPKVPATIPSQAKYRDPDAIRGAWEAFERVLQGRDISKVDFARSKPHERSLRTWTRAETSREAFRR
jgi:hypothetical protein